MSDLQPGYEMASILVTVKTYPSPSTRHVETVCVAGVRLDTPQPEWIRLYPIPFRVTTFDYEFAKYQVVQVPVKSRGTHDPRPESFSPDNGHFQLGEKINTRRGWERRRELLGQLVGATTTCELIRANRAVRMSEPAPSLGLVKPRDVCLTVKPGKGWKPNQLAKVKAAAEPTLFDGPDVYTELEPNPYEMRIRYRCMDAACRGHDQQNLDWEVGSAAYNWRKHYPEDEIAQRIQKKWEAMFTADKDTHLFLGNLHQYRHSFSVLGVWYPPN